MIRCRHARHPRPLRSFDRHRRPAYKTGWPSCRRRGIGAHSTSNPLNRSRKRAPNLRVSDRIIAGLCTLLMHPSRILRCGIVLKPSTLLHFHHVLTKRKYQLLFSSQRGGRPGPNGPAQELIDAVVEMKRRNPSWGCPRIAQQLTLAFGVGIDKDVVRRIPGKYYAIWTAAPLIS